MRQGKDKREKRKDKVISRPTRFSRKVTYIVRDTNTDRKVMLFAFVYTLSLLKEERHCKSLQVANIGRLQIHSTTRKYRLATNKTTVL